MEEILIAVTCNNMRQVVQQVNELQIPREKILGIEKEGEYLILMYYGKNQS